MPRCMGVGLRSLAKKVVGLFDALSGRELLDVVASRAR